MLDSDSVTLSDDIPRDIESTDMWDPCTPLTRLNVTGNVTRQCHRIWVLDLDSYSDAWWCYTHLPVLLASSTSGWKQNREVTCQIGHGAAEAWGVLVAALAVVAEVGSHRRARRPTARPGAAEETSRRELWQRQPDSGYRSASDSSSGWIHAWPALRPSFSAPLGRGPAATV
jgi:hypothetical protein